MPINFQREKWKNEEGSNFNINEKSNRHPLYMVEKTFINLIKKLKN